jgi:hypothetical protein
MTRAMGMTEKGNELEASRYNAMEMSEPSVYATIFFSSNGTGCV